MKGQPTPYDGEAGQTGLMQKKKNKRKVDEASGLSGTSVQQKVKGKKRKGSSGKKKAEGSEEESIYAPNSGGIKNPIDTDLILWH